MSLALIAFAMGASGLAYEYTFSKLSSDLLGFSAKQWAFVIALMMLFMGIGSDLQKHLKDKFLFEKFILMEIILSLVGGFAPIILLYLFGAQRDFFVLFQFLFIALVGLLVGTEIPIMIRLNAQYEKKLKVNLSGILRMDYIGGFFGALFWLYLLIRFRNISQIGLVFGIFNLMATFWAFYYFRTLTRYTFVFLLTIVLVLSICFCSLFFIPKWTLFFEQQLFRNQVVFSKTTPYQHIVLTKSSSGIFYCYINGNTQFSSFDEHIYHEMLVHPAMLAAKSHANILILGGGDGLALREILKYKTVEKVTLVDIDPQMTEFARTNPYFLKLNQGSLNHEKVTIISNKEITNKEKTAFYLPDRRSRPIGLEKKMGEVFLIHMDAAAYIDQVKDFYDVIILDFPDPNQLGLVKLYSLSFYKKLQEKLRPYGIIAQQATSSVYSKETFLCIGRTLKKAGFSAKGYHEVVPTFGDWGILACHC